MNQTCKGRFEKSDSLNTLGLIRNLGCIDLVLPCQADVEHVQSELWTCFWSTSSVDCVAHWCIAKSQDVSLTCLGHVPSVDLTYKSACGESWECSKHVWDVLCLACIKELCYTHAACYSCFVIIRDLCSLGHEEAVRLSYASVASIILFNKKLYNFEKTVRP